MARKRLRNRTTESRNKENKKEYIRLYNYNIPITALGAIRNRLEHAIKNLDNVVANTTAAKSQIRDTDMATEMVIT